MINAETERRGGAEIRIEFTPRLSVCVTFVKRIGSFYKDTGNEVSLILCDLCGYIYHDY